MFITKRIKYIYRIFKNDIITAKVRGTSDMTQRLSNRIDRLEQHHGITDRRPDAPDAIQIVGVHHDGTVDLPDSYMKLQPDGSYITVEGQPDD